MRQADFLLGRFRVAASKGPDGYETREPWGNKRVVLTGLPGKGGPGVSVPAQLYAFVEEDAPALFQESRKRTWAAWNPWRHVGRDDLPHAM